MNRDSWDTLKNHVIDINKKGDFSPIKFLIECPDTNKHQIEKQEKNPHDFVINIVNELEKKKYKKLLIYLHGGLVKKEEGVKEAIKLTKAVLKDPELQDEDKTYPVSIVWRSGGLESYMDQLIQVRNGEADESLALATAPLKFGSDLGRGLMDMPYAGGLEGNRLIKSLKNEMNECYEDVNIICPPEGNDFSHIPAPETILYFLLTPLRIATSPFVNGLGRPSWENMIRRTRAAFIREKPELSSAVATDSFKRSGYEGGVYLFFKELHEHLPANTDIKMTLIAHSMGTMLASELFVSFPTYLMNGWFLWVLL